MKLALIGYGKMGKAIEEIALQRGHTIGLKINSSNLKDFNPENLSKCDVAIEFTSPETAFNNVKYLLENNVPVVCGSTGWISKLSEIEEICKHQNGAFLYASNFSVGVNIFFEISKQLAALMVPHQEYKVSVEEIHHTAKKDAPSGTAVTIAEQILAAYSKKNGWVNQATDDAEKLGIVSRREDPAPGTHSVKYSSYIDDIEIIHTAHNRSGFAKGAVLAAEFLLGKKGIFGMKEVLGL